MDKKMKKSLHDFSMQENSTKNFLHRKCKHFLVLRKINFSYIIAYILLGIVILGMVLLTFFPGIIQAWKDSFSSGDDKCKPAQGYTEESWREHMGHHPDIYKECLT